jgi:hypothetical protein
MTRFDDALIEKVTSPLCGWLRHRLGLCQWRAAIECLNGSAAFYLAAVAFEIAGLGPYDGIFVTLLRALVWLTILDRVRRLAYRQAASSVGVRTARVREWQFRTILATMLPVSLCYADSGAHLLYSTSLALLVFHLYLKASDTPPPEPKGRFALDRA